LQSSGFQSPLFLSVLLRPWAVPPQRCATDILAPSYPCPLQVGI
jgi:hypothetical protein